MSDFYEAFYRRAQEAIPEFLFDQVKAQALPLSGANARWKSSIPTIFEKLALPALQPENLGKLKNAELKSVIRRIDKLYRSAHRAKEDTAMFQKAAAWVVKEMKGRKLGVDHKLAVLQEFVGKSDEEIAEGLKEEVTKRGYETDNTGAPINPRGFNVGETFALVEEHGRWEQEAANYEPRAKSPYQVCGACRFFIRDPESAVGTCQVVKGPINWFGTSDLYISAQAEAIKSFSQQEEAVHEAMMDQAFGVEKAVEGGGSNDDNNTDPQKPKMIITVKELIQKRIKREGDEYVVTDDSGKKELGRHSSRAAAIRQLAAIEAKKDRSEKAAHLDDKDEMEKQKKKKKPYEYTTETKKAGPTLSQVHTPGSGGDEDEKKLKKQKQKRNDPMGALSHSTDKVSPKSQANVKDKPKAMPDSVGNFAGSAKVSKNEEVIEIGDPVLPDSTQLRVDVDFNVPIAKIDEEQKKVYGVVLEPDEVDTQGDTISMEEIEKAAEGFMKKARNIGLRHRKIAKGVTLTDSYVTQGETKLGKDTLKKGTWIIGVKIENEAIWQGIKNGEYTGFSVGGFGQRKKNA